MAEAAATTGLFVCTGVLSISLAFVGKCSERVLARLTADRTCESGEGRDTVLPDHNHAVADCPEEGLLLRSNSRPEELRYHHLPFTIEKI